ncbi:MAG: alpha-hydroxy acid oxidase [Pseudomonadota bacterium]
MPRPINLIEYETRAAQHLSTMAMSYFAGGAADERTLVENRAAFSRYHLRPRVLVDVSKRSLETRLLGQNISLPVIIAPSAFHCLSHPDGELATARAAANMGTIMVLSTMSTKSLEEVAIAADAPKPLWFQLYVHRDRYLTQTLVERAEAAGYQALCVTVDAPVLGQRERERRNHFTLPPGMELANLATFGNRKIPATKEGSGLLAYFAEQLDPGLTWRDLVWLQSLTQLPVVVKGILRADDAQMAIEHGARAIIVSNHGGRQLDGSIATIDALGEITAAVGNRAEILMDGGVRRGTDVLKALALGAKAVLLGRPILWGLAVDGQAGVQHVLQLLMDELDTAMALSGCANVSDVDSSLIHSI